MHTMANSEDPDEMPYNAAFLLGSTLLAKTKTIFRERNTDFLLKIISCDPSIHTMDHPKFIHQPRTNSPLVHKGLKGLISIITLIPLRISFIILILESLRVICFT